MGSADVAMSQMFFLQCLNVLSVTFFLANNNLIKILKKSVSNVLVNTLFLFIIWSSFTSIYALNFSESLRIISELLVYLSSISLIIGLFSLLDNSRKFIFNFFLALLIIELSFILFPYLIDLENGAINFGDRSTNYKGITGNINIAAFSILLKIPILFFKYCFEKKGKLIYILLYIISGIVILTILQTRAAIITLLLLNIIYFLNFLLYSKSEKKLFQRKYLTIGIASFIILSFNLITIELFSQSNNAVEKITSLGNQNDQSYTERYNFYTHAIESILKNPIFGIGIGNWELESINYNKENIKGYVVPYHTHNDFLEITAETGIPGFLLYYGILIITIFLLLKRYFSRQKSTEKNQIFLTLFLILFAFSMDSLMNFPFARPIQQIQYFVILILSITTLSIENYFTKINSIFKRTQIAILIGLLPFLTYSQFRILNSYRGHRFLLGMYNANNYSPVTDEIVENYDDIYPSIVGTTIPTKALKAVYFIRKNDDYDKGISLLKKSILLNENPYLGFNETWIGWSYFRKGMYDSARFYSKIAFDKIPNNVIHYAHYMGALAMLKDTLEINRVRNKINIEDDLIDQLYLMAMADVIDKDEFNLAESKISVESIRQRNDQTKKSYYFLEFGKEDVLKAGILHKQGEALFEKGEFSQAAEKFEEATKLNSLEIPYFENAANAYMQINNNEKALYFLDYILENLDSNSEKSLLMKGIIHLDLNQSDQACEALKKAADLNMTIAKQLFTQYCLTGFKR